MARHSVAVKLPDFSLGGSPIEFAVTIDGVHAGFLIISRGSVDWKDTRRQTTGGSSWGDLRDYLANRGPRRVRRLVTSSGRKLARERATRQP
jgi:hypothetical protein